MNTAVTILLMTAATCAVFAAWGICTEQGRKAYEGMAGMVPYFSGVAGLVLGIIGIALYLWNELR